MIKENLEKIKNRIQIAEKKSGRSENSVKLMAVSKFHPVSQIIEAVEQGQFLFGENRVQEAVQKFTDPSFEGFKNKISLHQIGQLQSNKVKQIVKIADCIESVDRIELLQEIEKQCAKIEKKIQILFEIHTAEDSKSGYNSEKLLFESLKACSQNDFPHITAKGFMTMAPFTQDERLIRNSFITLRTLSEKMKKEFPNLDLSELSMGMSNDFEIAIEEGSTIVRVGTAIFGERNYSR